MDTGTKISASAHVVLLGAMVLGNPFRSDPLPMNVQEVAVITSEQFAALQAVQPTPQPAPEVSLPEVSPPEPESPEVPQTDAAPEAETPQQVADAPEPEEPPAIPEPAPETDVTDEAPVLPQPEEQVAVLAPETAEEAVPQQADRVAPEPVAPPDPETVPDEIEQDAVTEDAPGTEAQETQEATAPEEATSELVTEADEAAAAPRASLRPPANRPARPAPAPEPEDTAVEDAVAAAVAEAQSNPEPAAPARSSAPITSSEREGLRVFMSSCWNVGALSTAAQETKVTVYVAMNQDGTPRVDSIRFLDFDGGTRESAAKVYLTALSAIVRCGRKGFPLPVEKYDQWKEIEMTFNPEGMFWR